MIFRTTLPIVNKNNFQRGGHCPLKYGMFTNFSFSDSHITLILRYIHYD